MLLKTYDNMYREFDIDSDGYLIGKNVQDVGDIVKYTKELQNSGTDRKEEFRHYARIPVIFVEQWMREYGITSMNKALMEIMYRKVNDEFKDFKVTNTYETYRA